MKQEVTRFFLAALGFGLYLAVPGFGSLPRAEAAISSLDRTLPQAAADDEEDGSDDSGGDEEGSEDDSD